MTETELNALLAGITPANEAARAAAHAHWASLAKPLGGLGRLETMLKVLCMLPEKVARSMYISLYLRNIANYSRN